MAAGPQLKHDFPSLVKSKFLVNYLLVSFFMFVESDFLWSRPVVVSHTNQQALLSRGHQRSTWIHLLTSPGAGGHCVLL